MGEELDIQPLELRPCMYMPRIFLCKELRTYGLMLHTIENTFVRV